MAKYRCTLVFTGSMDDLHPIYKIAGGVRRNARTEWIGCSLDELSDLLETMTLFITLNTFPMHVAAAKKIPTLALVGGTAASIVCPDAENFWYIEGKDLIVDNITVEEVMRKVGEILD